MSIRHYVAPPRCAGYSSYGLLDALSPFPRCQPQLQERRAEGQVSWCVFLPGPLTSDRIENLARKNWVCRRLEIAISHIARHDLVVFAHALDHEIFDQFANAQLEFIQRVGKRGLNDLLVLYGFLFDLLEEQSILFRELRSEPLVKHLNDFGQRSLLILGPASADFGWALDCLRIAWLEINRPCMDALQAIELEFNFIPYLYRTARAVEREVTE